MINWKELIIGLMIMAMLFLGVFLLASSDLGVIIDTQSTIQSQEADIWFHQGSQIHGNFNSRAIYVLTDNETGVEYLVYTNYNADNLYVDAMCLRVDRDGKPMISESWLAAQRNVGGDFME